MRRTPRHHSPWVGAELSNYVSILLKTSEEDDPKDLRKYIHQARVRRTIVVQLIEDAHARGHRAYRNIHMSQVFVGFENPLGAVTLSTGKTGDPCGCAALVFKIRSFWFLF